MRCRKNNQGIKESETETFGAYDLSGAEQTCMGDWIK